MTLNPMYYSEDVKKITKIEFTIYKNDDVKLYSAVSSDPYGIDLTESYENYEPKKGGLVDIRLGSCDLFLQCSTCGEKHLDCPGHFGHTVLSEPVFHYGFLPHLRNILSCICLECSKLLIDKTDIYFKKYSNKKPEIRFKEIKNITKNVNTCYYCNWPVHKIKKEEKDNGTIKIIIERTVESENDETKLAYQKSIREILSPRDCYNILRNISDEECFILGFNYKVQRPEDMIIINFPIPPVVIRPTAKVDFMSAATMEDSLTLKIADIINANKRLRQQKEKDTITDLGSIYNQDLFTLLQFNVINFYNNEIINLPRTEFKTGNTNTKCITTRIQGKSGRVRCNLMGKRVDFSARAVITSDPYVDIDELGVPLVIATELTIPEEVTPNNIKYLNDLIKNGRDKYPGANYVFKYTYRDDKEYVQKIDLKYRKKSIKLNVGDIVERHIINGDYVLFNRQPTLHKPSMMGHRIQVINNPKLNTFRMNVSVCKPYNADFDGDEMNIHLAQSIQTTNEIKRISNVKYQIIGVKNSHPIIGCEQDTLAGAYTLTNTDIKIIGYDVANLLANTTSDTKREIDMKKIYTGHEIFSFIIPKGINHIKKNNDKILLEIIDGKLIQGSLDASALSSAKHSIIHFIWDKFGPDKTRRFIDDSQRLILHYLLYEGQSCGFQDTYIDDNIKLQIKHLVANSILENKYNITQLENSTVILSLNEIENELTKKLNMVQSEIGQILMGYLKNNNFFYTAAKSGAKGGLTYIAQMLGALGQINLEGSRFKKKVENRSLIYYHKNDDTPEARGFVSNSYLSGLNLTEFYYNVAAGREGGIDTAIKTATSGYITRQLTKGLEDLIIKYDATNRNSKNLVIQLVYGENGINQACQSEISLTIINMNNDDIKLKLCFTDEEINTLSAKTNNKKELIKFNEQFINKLITYRDKLRIIQQSALINFRIIEEKHMLPVNLYRITQDYKNKNKKIDLTLSPHEIENAIEDLLNNYDNRIITFISPTDKYLKNDDRSIKFLFAIGLYEYLSPKKCIFEYNLTKDDFYKMINDIRNNFIKSIIEPGEMVGIIAAQTIGEPTTQLTLNTKHFAGVAGKGSANMGISRIQELLHYSKNIKTPQMIIYFNQPYASNRTKLNKIVSYFNFLSLRQLCSTIEVYYCVDNSKNNYDIKLKNDNVSNPFFVNNQKVDINSLPIIFRFKLDIEKMMDMEISLLDIKTKFIYQWYTYYSNSKVLKKHEKEVIKRIVNCVILSNNLTDKEQVIHIRFNMISFNYDLIKDYLKMILDDIKLKGINNIKNMEVEEERVINFDKDTGAIKADKEFVVYTNGINIELLRNIKNIDFKRTRCNNIATILRLYGIEACRQILLHEISQAFVSGGTNINYNHLSILVDQMTHLGEIVSIDRHGMTKIDTDPLAKASFEKTMNHFVNAALFNEEDTMTSVSSCIMLGKVMPGGTGSFELLLDTKKLENSEYIDDETGGRITFMVLDEEPLIKDILKNSSNYINFYIPNKI